jgi:hypothetical protein
MGIVGATLVVALQGGHKTRPYRLSPLTPLYERGEYIAKLAPMT